MKYYFQNTYLPLFPNSIFKVISIYKKLDKMLKPISMQSKFIKDKHFLSLWNISSKAELRKNKIKYLEAIKIKIVKFENWALLTACCTQTSNKSSWSTEFSRIFSKGWCFLCFLISAFSDTFIFPLLVYPVQSILKSLGDTNKWWDWSECLNVRFVIFCSMFHYSFIQPSGCFT